VLVANSRKRLLRAGSSDTILQGSSGNDTLIGGLGNDTLIGFRGDDRLVSGRGNNVLIGGQGNDTLISGRGSDTLAGGPGADDFVFTTANKSRDLIVDFNPQQGDRINLSQIFSGSNYGSADRFSAYVQLKQESGGTLLRVDANGDAAGGLKALALLQGVRASSLQSANFIVS
jgi:surface adhesion protein